MALKTKSPVFSYVFFAIAVVIAGAAFAGIIPTNVAEVLVGLFGFSGLAGLRAYIDSQGWKTYFSVVMGIVGIVIRFVFPDVFTPEELAQWLTFWGIAGAGALVHGVEKTKRGGKK